MNFVRNGKSACSAKIRIVLFTNKLFDNKPEVKMSVQFNDI